MLAPDLSRPSWDEYFLAMAAMVSTRSTCVRRMVGMVLTDVHHRVLSSGYNGTAPGAPHCIDQPCAGATAASGTNLQDCESSHAEISGLADCADRTRVDTVYLTTAPCSTCVTALLLTSATRLVFLDDYPGSEESRRRWERSGRIWHHFEGDSWQRVFSMASSRSDYSYRRRSAVVGQPRSGATS